MLRRIGGQWCADGELADTLVERHVMSRGERTPGESERVIQSINNLWTIDPW